jgi:hypothetical protein
MKTITTWLLTLVLATLAGAVQSQESGGSVGEDPSERHFEVLNVGDLSFTNVWVHRQTNFNILIRHSRGIHTIKLTDLPSDQLVSLQSQIGDLASITPPKSGGEGGRFLDKIRALLAGASQRTLIIGGAIGFLLIVLLVMKMRKPGDVPPAA